MFSHSNQSLVSLYNFFMRKASLSIFPASLHSIEIFLPHIRINSSFRRTLEEMRFQIEGLRWVICNLNSHSSVVIRRQEICSDVQNFATLVALADFVDALWLLRAAPFKWRRVRSAHEGLVPIRIETLKSSARGKIPLAPGRSPLQRA